MSVSYDFSGQAALATGAASGMGLAAARAFADAGAAVALADIRSDVPGAATQELAAAGHRVIGLAGHFRRSPREVSRRTDSEYLWALGCCIQQRRHPESGRRDRRRSKRSVRSRQCDQPERRVALYEIRADPDARPR